MRKILSLVIVFVCMTTIKGQYVADALRYSQNFPTFSARSLSMGGAFTSLGGDFSSTYLNPAGLGLYRKSEFVLSPGLGYFNTKAKYFGQTNEDYEYQFIFSNAGYVGTYNSGRDKGLVSAAYAIGYNRLNNFNTNILMRGTNPNSSLSDVYVESANRDNVNPENLFSYSERLFYDAWLINQDNEGYYSLVPVPVDQSKMISTRGGSGEWTFSGGMNFSNRVYIGLGLGLTSLKYKQNTVHSEVYNGTDLPFRAFDYHEDLNVEGTGFNMRLGAIVRIAKSLRLGTSLTLPTFYSIREEYFSSVFSEFDDSTFFINPTDINGNELGTGRFEYRLNTPLKLGAGLSYQIGKSGIISGDVEYINYASMKLRNHVDFNSMDDRSVISSANDGIDKAYRSVFNVRLGGEVRFGNFAVRAGGGYYPSPYMQDEMNKDASYTELTAGMGYRNKNVFIDFGLSNIFHNEKYNLYSSGTTDNISSLDQNAFRFITTIGFRF